MSDQGESNRGINGMGDRELDRKETEQVSGSLGRLRPAHGDRTSAATETFHRWVLVLNGPLPRGA